MKEKSGETMNLKAKTVEALESIKAKLQTIKNPEELIEVINAIGDFGEKTLLEYAPSGNINVVNSLQRETAELYATAANTVEKSSFSEVGALKSFIESMKESYLRSVESKKEEIADTYREKGCEFRENGDYQKAGELLNKAMEIDAKDPRNWFERGNLFFDEGDFVKAIHDYEMVLESDPSNPNALCNIGLSLNSMFKFADSLKYFDKSLRIAPNYVEALVGMGNSYFRIGKFDNAEDALTKALRLEPNNVNANLTMGALMHEYDYKTDKAKYYAENVLKLDPNNIVAKANLSEVLLAFGEREYERSANLALEVLKDGPAHLGYPMQLIVVCSLYFRKRIEEATGRALDLVEYFETVRNNIVIPWKFLGLRRTIANNKDISEDVHSLLNKLIDLVETTDVYVRNRLLKELPEMVRSVDSTARFMRPIISPKEESKPASEREISVENKSKPDRFRKGYYDWEIFLTPQDALGEIEKVVYTLHETFPDRFREVKDRTTGFKLVSNGWGEFQVKVDIYFKNRAEPIVKYHWLKLRSPAR